MTRLVKIASAAGGMALLAGLAVYQGHVDFPDSGDQSLTGTAISEQLESDSDTQIQPACNSQKRGGDLSQSGDSTDQDNLSNCDSIASAQR